MKLRARALRLCVAAMAGFGALAAGAQTAPRARLFVQLGHSEGIRSVAFSPDGQFVLTASPDNTARLWEAASGRELRRFEGHTNAVSSAVFSQDGRYILTGSADDTARLWNAETGKELQRFLGHEGMVYSVAFSIDGRRVLTGGGDKTARLWDASTGKELLQFRLNGDVRSVAFSPDGSMVLTSGFGIAKLWDAETGKELRQFSGHTSYVYSVAFSRDGSRILTGSDDNTARLWNVETGEELQRFNHSDWIFAVALSPDGRWVLTGSEDHAAELWDSRTGMQVRRFEGHSKTVNSVAFSPDGQKVLTGSEDRTARLWNLETGKEMQRFEGHTSWVDSVAFSPDGRRLVTGSAGNTAFLWDSETGKEFERFEGHADQITSVAFSPDGHSVLTGSDDKTARLWDAENGKELRRFVGHTDEVTFATISPDGGRVLTGSKDKSARLWDVDTGKELRIFNGGFMDTISSVMFAPGGQTLLTGGSNGIVILWDASNGQKLQYFKTPWPVRAANGQILRYLTSQRSYNDAAVGSVAFSPGGRFVLTGGADNTARLWDAATGQQIRTFDGHTGGVNSVAFSPDGRFVLTGSDDKTARLWDVETGNVLERLEGHSSRIFSVAFSPDGHLALAGSQDGTTKLWDAANGKELATLVSFTDGGWAVVDREGRFDTSDLDGGAPMQWIVDDDPMRSLPLEIFMRDYYTPRLLSRLMNGETLPPIRSIAEITNRVQPDVAVVSVSASKTHAGRADVVVHAASHTNEKGRASGLQNLRLFRNGQLVANTPLDRPLESGDFTFTDIQLPTSAKTAIFTAYAFNHDENQREQIKSATTAPFDFNYEPGAVVRPRAYLLQIGVNHYQAKGCELHGSATDAEELGRVLSERLTKRGLDVRAVRLVSTDAESGATKEGIKEALKAIAAEATPDDVFFLSFSGHGYGDKDGQFYIFPADVEGSCSGVDDAMLKGAISADELTEWLRPIDAGEMTLVLDSCQSASSVEANDFKPGPMGSRGLGQLAYDKRMRILAASQSNQEAQERNLPVANGAGEGRTQGLVSYALTQEGLVDGKADWKPPDGKIMVGEWLSYAADAVPKSLEAGAVKTKRGMMRIGAPTAQVKSAQIPAVFDFSKKDTFVLQ